MKSYIIIESCIGFNYCGVDTHGVYATKENAKENFVDAIISRFGFETIHEWNEYYSDTFEDHMNVNCDSWKWDNEDCVFEFHIQEDEFHN